MLTVALGANPKTEVAEVRRRREVRRAMVYVNYRIIVWEDVGGRTTILTKAEAKERGHGGSLFRIQVVVLQNREKKAT